MAGKDPSDDDSAGEGIASAYRKAGPYLDASWGLVAAVGLWTLIGWFLDRKFHTQPWLLVAGAVLGVITGFYLFFKAMLQIGKKKP